MIALWLYIGAMFTTGGIAFSDKALVITGALALVAAVASALARDIARNSRFLHGDRRIK